MLGFSYWSWIIQWMSVRGNYNRQKHTCMANILLKCQIWAILNPTTKNAVCANSDNLRLRMHCIIWNCLSFYIRVKLTVWTFASLTRNFGRERFFQCFVSGILNVQTKAAKFFIFKHTKRHKMRWKKYRVLIVYGRVSYLK